MPRSPGTGGGLPFKTGHLFLLGAIVMAVVTAVLFTNVLKKTSAEKPKELDTATVVVAADYVPAGTILMSQHVQRVDWPKKFLAKKNYFAKSSDVVGKMVRSDLIPGEIIYKQKLAGDTSRGGLPVMIPEGMRGVTVGVTEIKGVAGFVKPGDFVDVLATFELKVEGGGKSYVTKTILQNVMVLASAQTMVNETSPQIEKPEGLTGEEEEEAQSNSSNREDKRKSARDIEKENKAREKARKEAEKRAKTTSSVTLALWPEQVEKLALAEESAELHLALRPEGDNSTAAVDGVNMDQLLTGRSSYSWPFSNVGTRSEPPDDFDKLEEMTPPPAPSLPEPAPGFQIEVIEGTTKSSVSF
jgi:pilus assembly protein CpaB